MKPPYSNSFEVVHAAAFLIDEYEFSIAPRSLYCSICCFAQRRRECDLITHIETGDKRLYDPLHGHHHLPLG